MYTIKKSLPAFRSISDRACLLRETVILALLGETRLSSRPVTSRRGPSPIVLPPAPSASFSCRSWRSTRFRSSCSQLGSLGDNLPVFPTEEDEEGEGRHERRGSGLMSGCGGCILLVRGSCVLLCDHTRGVNSGCGGV